MYDSSLGKGQNPFTVNVVTYSGHGFTFGGDAIAAIPTYESEKEEEIKGEDLKETNSNFDRKYNHQE